MAFVDPKTKLDGQLGVAYGMNAGVSPREVSENQFAGMLNGSARTGIPHPRPGFPLLYNQGDTSLLPASLILNADGHEGMIPIHTFNDTTGARTTTLQPWTYSFNFPGTNIQGGMAYRWNGENYGLVVIDGQVFIWRCSDYNYDFQLLKMADGTSLVCDPTRPVCLCQARNYMVIQNGVGIPLIYNGQKLRYADYSNPSLPEVPTGMYMKYLQGRLFVSDGRDLRVGDLLGGAISVNNVLIGTSPITFGEELIYSAGNSFNFPADITGIGAAPKMDSATGWGELIVFSKFGTYAINAEVTDRSQWSTTSIQRVIFENIGCESHWSIVPIGTDLYWRSADGIRSFRNSTSAGSTFTNTLIATSRPISVEVNPFIESDEVGMIDRIQATYVNNRLLMTAFPTQLTNNGCAAFGFLSLDFATTLTTGTGNSFGALNPAWDGLWMGIRPCFFMQLEVEGNIRTFAFCTDSDGLNRIWEIPNRDEWIHDAENTGLSQPIQWMYDTRGFSFGSGFVPKELLTLQQGYQKAWGEGSCCLWYSADGEECWHPLGQWEWNVRDYQVGEFGTWEDLSSQHFPNVRPEHPKKGTGETGTPWSQGCVFQFRLAFSGYAWLHKLMPITRELKDTTTGAVIMTTPSETATPKLS